MEKKIYGLSMQEVEEKRKKGEGEQEPESITKKQETDHPGKCADIIQSVEFHHCRIVIRSGSVYQHDLHRDHYTEYRDWDRTGMQSQETGR